VTVIVSRGYQWVADSDRVAHAVPDRGRQLRTLCGLRPVDPRYGWPAVVRCPACQEVVDRP
jgi:hypothetical protein